MRCLALLGVSAGALVVPAAVPAHAGPTTSGSAKVAVRIDAAGEPQVLTARSGLTAIVPAGTVPTATRFGVGRYQITIPVIDAAGGNAQLVQWGAKRGNPPVCTIGRWSTRERATDIEVNCFDAETGSPREGTRFDVLYTNETMSLGTLGHTFFWSGFVPTRGAVIVPTEYHFSGRGAAAPTITRTARGAYDVEFAEAVATWTPLVTAYADDARWCHGDSAAATSSTTTRLRIVCFGPGGQPRDSRFSVTMLGGAPLTGFTTGRARLRVTRPGATGLVTPPRLNFTATGVPNTHERLDTGRQEIILPGVRRTVDVGAVAAVGSSPGRCVLLGTVTTVTDPSLGGYRTRCIDPQGRNVDLRMWAVRSDLVPLWSR